MQRKKVQVYSKPGCSLCEEAKDALRRVQQRVDFDWTEVDITSDLELRRRFRYDIPVVALEGEPIFRHHVDEDELERRLRS